VLQLVQEDYNKASPRL